MRWGDGAAVPMRESYTILQFYVGIKYCLHHLQQQWSCPATYKAPFLHISSDRNKVWWTQGWLCPWMGKGGIVGLGYSISPVPKTPSYRLQYSYLFSHSFMSFLLQLLGVIQWNTLEERICRLPFVHTYSLFEIPIILRMVISARYWHLNRYFWQLWFKSSLSASISAVC